MTEDRRLTGFALHIIAMLLMLTDHLRFAFPDARLWLFAVGRLAFPIFAFLTAEGIKHTRDVKKYALRLLALAVSAEIPFDLLSSGTFIAPGHQNVIWTLLLSVITVSIIKKYADRAWVCGIAAAAAFIIAEISRTDYGGFGVMTVFFFYFLDGETKRDRLALVLGIAFVNLSLAVLDSAPIQLFALLALPVIFLYDGRRGCHGRAVRLLFYGFYPAHLLAVWALTV